MTRESTPAPKMAGVHDQQSNPSRKCGTTGFLLFLFFFPAGQGLGRKETGITEPIKVGIKRDHGGVSWDKERSWWGKWDKERSWWSELG